VNDSLCGTDVLPRECMVGY